MSGEDGVEIFFFFSSRKRHTSSIGVTGVQTCALPIYLASKPRFVVLTMTDTVPTEDAAAAERALAKHVGSSVPSAVVSAVAQQGIELLRQALWEIVEGMLQNEDTEG